MAHVIQLASGAFMSSPRGTRRTKSWEAHERAQPFGENQSIDIGKSQRHRKEGNARINKVSAMRPGIAKIIETVHNSRHFESQETDLHRAENACRIDHAGATSSKRVHWPSTIEISNHSSTDYRCEKMVEFDNGDAWKSLLITRIHPRVAQESKIQRLPVTLYNIGWIDHRQVCDRSFKAIPILHPVDVNKAYG